MNLDSLAEMEHPAFLVVKEKEAILVFRDPRDPSSHQRLQREPKENRDSQVPLIQLFSLVDVPPKHRNMKDW